MDFKQIALIIIIIFALCVIELIIYMKGWGKGYKEGFYDCERYNKWKDEDEDK